MHTFAYAMFSGSDIILCIWIPFWIFLFMALAPTAVYVCTVLLRMSNDNFLLATNKV